ncbi:MAG: hypothetical protein HY287_11690 [Planctomycetes bacterium]|nr:hypothetical protein [Planctomycetota bacterium]
MTSLCEARPRPNGTPCEDGLFCTSHDGCVEGICTGGASPCALHCDEANNVCVQCLSVLDCNDGIACTDDSCNSGTCVHQANNSLCEDDGLFCNGQVVCSAHSGCISTGNPCPQTDVCNEDTNSCNECLSSEDCIVDNPCILERSCVEGRCQGGTRVDCSAFGDQCNASMCDTFGAPGNCDIRTALDDGTPCDDGLFCTTGDACASGSCADSTPKDCSGISDQCHVGTCDEKSNACVAYTVSDGTICNDGLFCTINDRCGAGECLGEQRDCREFGNACNTAVCNEDTNACESHPVENGTICDDGNACTANDVCSNGTCHGQPLSGLAEWLDLADCLKGPNEATSIECECSDLNHDGHVDLRDTALFMNEFTTP